MVTVPQSFLWKKDWVDSDVNSREVVDPVRRVDVKYPSILFFGQQAPML